MKQIKILFGVIILIILLMTPISIFGLTSNKITSISIIIDSPKLEMTPSDLNDSLKLIGNFKNDLTLESITWYKSITNDDNADWIEISNDEEFIEGYYYAFDAYYLANNLFEIDSNIIGMINGNYHNDKFGSVYSNITKAYLSYEWLPLFYSYEFISGNNQSFIEGSINSYTFTIDANSSNFESLYIDNIKYEDGIDFIVTKGSTVITFTETGIKKLNRLSVGNKNIEVNFINNKIANGTLIIVNNINPNTSDKIMIYFIIGFISLICIILFISLIKKKAK